MGGRGATTKEQCRSTGTKNMFCHSRTSLIATKTLAVGLKLLPEYKFRSAKHEHVDRTNLNIIHQFLQPDTLEELILSLSLSLCLSPASRTSGSKGNKDSRLKMASLLYLPPGVVIWLCECGQASERLKKQNPAAATNIKSTNVIEGFKLDWGFPGMEKRVAWCYVRQTKCVLWVLLYTPDKSNQCQTESVFSAHSQHLHAIICDLNINTFKGWMHLHGACLHKQVCISKIHPWVTATAGGWQFFWCSRQRQKLFQSGDGT